MKMRLILSASTVVFFFSLSCLQSQHLLAQEIPVAGNAIEQNKNTSADTIPDTGPAIDRSQSRPKKLVYVDPSVRRESKRRIRRPDRTIVRRESTPQVRRSVTYTPPRESVQIRRRPARIVPKPPSIPQNFPIRRG